MSCTESKNGDVYSVNCLTSEDPSNSTCTLDGEEIDCERVLCTIVDWSAFIEFAELYNLVATKKVLVAIQLQ